MNELFTAYQGTTGYDEMFDGDGPRATYAALHNVLSQMNAEQYVNLQAAADLETLSNGITFTVYADNRGTERIFPFSLVPRIVAANEWLTLSEGMAQRVTALNRFLADAYTEHHCVKDGVIPPDLVLGHPGYLREASGVVPPLGCYVHVAGCDVIRCEDGAFRVLEDNLRTPSGVSYVIENRRTMRGVVPHFFPKARVASVDDYAERLLDALIACRPPAVRADDAKVVVLTPGPFNSAYFEHTFLARQMGVELVEGQDLLVEKDRVYMRATTGLEPVHVIYRRIDDTYLDPRVFREDSALGVPGLFGAYAAGNVTVANAIGNGVADDKATFRYVPDLVRYYLGEEPIIENVPTFLARRPDDMEVILDTMPELVVKPTDGSGGYGVFIGEQADSEQIEGMRRKVKSEPNHWIAQPLQRFSTIPTFDGDSFHPHRCDLRLFVVTGEKSWVLPGGLTRVAATKESFIVNSSQGGGSKDTWVLTGARNGAG